MSTGSDSREFERELLEESDAKNLEKAQHIKKNAKKIRSEKKKLAKEVAREKKGYCRKIRRSPHRPRSRW